MPKVSKLQARARLNSMSITADLVPDTVLDAVLAELDQDAIEADENANIVYEVWDRVSPINGVDPSYILSRTDVSADGECYIVKDSRTGSIVAFQPHVPGVGGMARMTAETVKSHAETHRSEIASQKAKDRIMESILKKLGAI